MNMSGCPCGLGEYESCCEPLHKGQQAAITAEQLMRSRYSAFARQQIDYIQSTTALGQQQALDIPAIHDWSVSNQWLQLDIVQANEKLDKSHALVEFKAHFHDGKQVQVHHEVSHFVKQAGRWYFLDPTLEQRLTMKQPCICGSGKKLKQCCEQFL
ncbi:YchJ family protein [Acinetobacter bohemicus]|uniref:YchJ family protein n=1 Tax=Acinetobacter TaxID=469 RepID=UPI001194C540|nr:MULTISPECIES: YchJ family protein [Acinetobacter]MCO8041082.1 YchJ family protein [Acinetobacter sp. S4400-12]MCU7224378.1 YchJ family protein [Acinetobacter bohemicus]TSH69142.1 YchJ family protein [Acinetobacter sp. RF15A]TSI19191.1 YchJ family protein [Acinetobacter sp. RF15B]